jgi:glyceraldehyde 3-phosphate dehydrogenase
MAVNLGINGFGRIGKLVLRAAFENKNSNVNVVAINHPFLDLDHMVYEIQHDSAQGGFRGTVEKSGDNLKVNGHSIKIFKEYKPELV